MKKRFTVEVRSDLYQSELFDYANKEELMEGVSRLYDAASETFQQDGVERELILVVS